MWVTGFHPAVVWFTNIFPHGDFPPRLYQLKKMHYCTLLYYSSERCVFQELSVVAVDAIRRLCTGKD